MGLEGTEAEGTKGYYSAERLTTGKATMEAVLRDPERLRVAEEFLQEGGDQLDPEQAKVLTIIVRSLRCYQMPPEGGLGWGFGF